MQNHLKIMSNCPIFPRPWHWLSSAHWGHYPCRQLIPLPRTYFEVEDIWPGEDEMSWITDKIFVSTDGGISIPKGIKPKKIAVFDGERITQVFNSFKNSRDDCQTLSCIYV